jgi:hypothetical protein
MIEVTAAGHLNPVSELQADRGGNAIPLALITRYWEGLRAVLPRTRDQPPQGAMMTQTLYP